MAATVYEYDFEAFTPAEKRQPVEAPKKKITNAPDLEIVKERRLTREELKQEARIVRRNTFFAVFAAVLVIVPIFLNVYVSRQCTELDYQIAKLQKEYDLLSSENAELSMELSNMVSLEQIEKIAVEELGLVRINVNDIEYVSTAQGSRVTVASGKALD